MRPGIRIWDSDSLTLTHRYFADCSNWGRFSILPTWAIWKFRLGKSLYRAILPRLTLFPTTATKEFSKTSTLNRSVQWIILPIKTVHAISHMFTIWKSANGTLKPTNDLRNNLTQLLIYTADLNNNVTKREQRICCMKTLIRLDLFIFLTNKWTWTTLCLLVLFFEL